LNAGAVDSRSHHPPLEPPPPKLPPPPEKLLLLLLDHPELEPEDEDHPDEEPDGLMDVMNFVPHAVVGK
jgi:hypothetical protein